MTELLTHLTNWWAVIIFYCLLVVLGFVIVLAVVANVRRIEDPRRLWTFTSLAEITTIAGLLVVLGASLFAMRDRLVTSEVVLGSLQVSQSSLEARVVAALEDADAAEDYAVQMSATVGDLVGRVLVLERLGVGGGSEPSQSNETTEIDPSELSALITQLTALKLEIEQLESNLALLSANALQNGDRVSLQGVSSKFLFDLDSRNRDELDVIMSGGAQDWRVQKSQ